jgi:pyruvate/2-oxoglutarate dehydrogenase complex dihydrolipoamide acyltransferase (E2) component
MIDLILSPRGADGQAIDQISQVVKELVERARKGHLMPDDISGGRLH